MHNGEEKLVTEKLKILWKFQGFSVLQCLSHISFTGLNLHLGDTSSAVTSKLVLFVSKLFSRTFPGNCIMSKLMIKFGMCINHVKRVRFYYGVLLMSLSEFLSH